MCTCTCTLTFIIDVLLCITGKELPAKKKVIDIETEPAHETTCTEGGIDIDMQYSAIISTAEYECPTKAISFKDTYVLQTKTFKSVQYNTVHVFMQHITCMLCLIYV